MRSLSVVIAMLFVAFPILLLPGELQGQERCRPWYECVGCENDDPGDVWHHFTSGTEMLQVCVDKTQDGHDTQSGCNEEPHETLCLEMCLSACTNLVLT